MYSKLVIDVDLNNQPIISAYVSKDTTDLRDKVMKRFVESFGNDHNVLQWVKMNDTQYEIKPVENLFNFILEQLEPLLVRDAYNTISNILYEKVDDPYLVHLAKDNL